MQFSQVYFHKMDVKMWLIEFILINGVSLVTIKPTSRRTYTTRKTTKYKGAYDTTPSLLPYDWGTVRPTVKVTIPPYPLEKVMVTDHTRFHPKTTTPRVTVGPYNDTWPHPTPRTLFARDHTTINDKRVMVQLIHTLVQDAIIKLTMISTTTENFEHSVGFSVGTIVGIIQARYRTMMAFWREIINKEWRWGGPPRTFMWPTAAGKDNIGAQGNEQIYERASLYYIIVYEMIHELKIEIFKLVELLLGIPKDHLEIPEQPLSPIPVTKMKTPYRTHIHDPDRNESFSKSRSIPVSSLQWEQYPEITEYNARRSRIEEQKYKKRVREQFLLRQMGLNESGHTPKPRFWKGWPVEETWDNLDYVNS